MGLIQSGMDAHTDRHVVITLGGANTAFLCAHRPEMRRADGFKLRKIKQWNTRNAFSTVLTAFLSRTAVFKQQSKKSRQEICQVNELHTQPVNY